VGVSAPAISEALAAIAGGDRVVSDPRALGAAAIDGVAPRWIVRPESVSAVSGVLTLATAEGLAVVPRGSGSALGLGNPPRRADLVLDTAGLAGITEYVPEDMVASVRAGTTLGMLGGELSKHGQRLALDPPRGASRTIGGVLATRGSGPLRFRYGTGRDLLLGARFVQADGTITWGGSRVVKSVTGYDVPKLLVGSLGTLGVIVEATLRLHPIPAATGSWLCAFDSADRTAAFLAALLASSLEPERIAILNGVAARASGLAAPVPGREAARDAPLVLVAVGSVEEAVASQGAALGSLARREGAAVGVAGPEAWGRLDAALDAPVLLELAGEIRRTTAWLGRAEQLAERAGLEAAGVGQAGNGILWLALRGAASGEAIARDVVRPLREELRAERGSVVVQRAPRDLKAALDSWGPVEPDALAIMARIKAEFDPSAILNPGRFAGGL
jgi:glycolate oxidase FAD binding subunit